MQDNYLKEAQDEKQNRRNHIDLPSSSDSSDDDADDINDVDDSDKKTNEKQE